MIEKRMVGQQWSLEKETAHIIGTKARNVGVQPELLR